MVVVCINKYSKKNKDEKLLTVGQEYNVYGLLVHKAELYYLVCDDGFDLEYRPFPIYRPSEVFKLVASDIPRDWVTRVVEERGEIQVLIGWEKFVNEDYYYGELVEGNIDPAKFIAYKNFIDA